MRMSKISLAAIALVVIAPLTVAHETIVYNGNQYTCQNGCIVEDGNVRDTEGGYVIEIREDLEEPIGECVICPCPGEELGGGFR